MEELKRIGVFTLVVDAQSFSEAARRLGIAKSAVSKQIRLLEQEVGVRLLNRTTRRLSLTEAGEIYYRHCIQIVNRAEIALNELQQYQNQPTGTIRVSSPIPFSNALLIPVIRELRSLYPEVHVDLHLSDQVLNLVEEGIDLAIRVGKLKDSNLIAKKLCDTPVVIFASPEYLALHGTPKTPDDISDHNWITLSILSSPIQGVFRHKISQDEFSPTVNSSLKTNSVETVIDAAEKGLGISAMVKTTVDEQLRQGKLVPLLEDYTLGPRELYAIYPHREHLPPKVRIFLDLLVKHCKSASWSISND